ncbi:MAG: M56 family metallopeptidase [Pseudomonadota bacterium]
MLAWIGYAVIVSALLGAAAFTAERAARMRKIGTRWIWGTAIVASLLLPTVISSISIELPNIFAPGVQGKPIVLRNAASVHLPSAAWIARKAAPLAAALPRNADQLLKRAWLAASITMLLALAASAVLLHVRKRRWPTLRIGAAQVYVAPNAGPAVVGLLRPRIVLPQWLTKAPPAQLELVMAHETAHLEARDPQLLSVALLLLVLMPWNLPLWWQLRRLRHAIEVDCDARVLRAGHDLRHYGEALVDVGQHQSGYLGAAAAMAESRSLLEQRIRIMLAAPGRASRAGALFMAGMALCMVAAAAQLGPPNAQMFGPGSDRHQIYLSPSRLLDYEGTFQLEQFQSITFTRDGRRLWSQVTGHEKLEMYPERQDAFFSRDINAQVRFQRDDHGRVIALELDRFGVTRPAPRVEGEAAKELEARIAEYCARSGPVAGGEEIVRRNADAVNTGRIHAQDLTPAFAIEAQARLTEMVTRSGANVAGKLVSITFQGINRDTGEDVYRVEYEKLILDWAILLDSDGKLAQAWLQNVPK